MASVFFAAVFGSGLVGVAYADNATVDVQERAMKERERIEALIRSRGIRYGSYPSFSVAVKGQKVSVKFKIPHGCVIFHNLLQILLHILERRLKPMEVVRHVITSLEQEDFYAVVDWAYKIDLLHCISMHGITECYLSGQKADATGFVRDLLRDLESRISMQFNRAVC